MLTDWSLPLSYSFSHDRFLPRCFFFLHFYAEEPLEDSHCPAEQEFGLHPACQGSLVMLGSMARLLCCCLVVVLSKGMLDMFEVLTTLKEHSPKTLWENDVGTAAQTWKQPGQSFRCSWGTVELSSQSVLEIRANLPSCQHKTP